mmetsp:Transcript_31540/g.71340  ORF Transcript_31540/g.71340 Transcript_31540/m.71340 type:complete len:207 (+) Transcript_31540:1115-1735(+)
MACRERWLEQSRYDVWEELPTSNTQYTSHAIKSSCLGVVILAFHRNKEGWDDFFQRSCSNSIIKILEALAGQSSNLVVFVADRVLHDLDKYLDILRHLLLARAVDDFCEANADTLSGIFVAVIQVVPQNRNDLRQNCVTKFLYDVSKTTARNLCPLGISGCQCRDDLSDKIRKNLAKRPNSDANHCLPNLNGRLANDCGSVASGKV